jgi:hypothetical protein
LLPGRRFLDTLLTIWFITGLTGNRGKSIERTHLSTYFRLPSAPLSPSLYKCPHHSSIPPVHIRLFFFFFFFFLHNFHCLPLLTPIVFCLAVWKWRELSSICSAHFSTS